MTLNNLVKPVLCTLITLVLLTGFAPMTTTHDMFGEPRPQPKKATEEHTSVVVSRMGIDRPYKKYREITLEITAYTAHDFSMDGKGITKSGLPVDKGVIAVDPKVIELGSVVWVPGVGYLVALDTGGAIKGYKADIYMESKEEALKWGRRKITVRVFDKR